MKQIQEGKCYRIYGPYANLVNKKTVYWVFDKTSKEKHICRNLVEVMKLIEQFQVKDDDE